MLSHVIAIYMPLPNVSAACQCAVRLLVNGCSMKFRASSAAESSPSGARTGNGRQNL